MGESSRARSTLEWARHGATRVARTPVSGLVVIAPLVLAGAVAAAPGNVGTPSVTAPGVMPVAAVVSDVGDRTGPAVVSVSRAPTSYRIASANISAPPPAIVVSSPGALRIPAMALSAYRNAERMMALAAPGCGISWNLLAGIGRIESMHANGGATDAGGTAVQPIYGPALDGSLPGNEIIVQSRGTNGLTYARAMGPMQFLPGTWARYASDGDGDGKANPQNLFDSTLAAARYLCSGGLNLREQSQVMSAILRYNNSMPYTRNVLGWAAAYATGVVPVNLPPITGSVPSSGGIGDAHLEDNPEGLGPGLPVNVLGLSPTDPLSQMPLVNFGSTDVASQLPNPAGPATAGPGCGMVCFGQSPMPPVAPGFAQPALGSLPGPAPGPVAAPPPFVAAPPPFVAAPPPFVAAPPPFVGAPPPFVAAPPPFPMAPPPAPPLAPGQPAGPGA